MEDFEQNNFENENSELRNSPEIPKAEYATEEEIAAYYSRRKFNRQPLIIALVGMILNVFYGLGLVFGIVAFFKAIKRYNFSRSEPLKWAIILSLVCVITSVIFIVALSFGFIVGNIRAYIPR